MKQGTEILIGTFVGGAIGAMLVLIIMACCGCAPVPSKLMRYEAGKVVDARMQQHKAEYDNDLPAKVWAVILDGIGTWFGDNWAGTGIVMLAGGWAGKEIKAKKKRAKA